MADIDRRTTGRQPAAATERRDQTSSNKQAQPAKEDAGAKQPFQLPDTWVAPTRSRKLIPLTGKHPYNAEPHLSTLMEAGFVTPAALHYVRNHGAVPKLDWSTHKVMVDGMVERQKEWSMAELVAAFPSVQVQVLISCDGNRRKEINTIRHTRGFNWGPGAAGCAVWKGVRLCDVLRSAGIKGSHDSVVTGQVPTEVVGDQQQEQPAQPVPAYVCFEGADEVFLGRYGTSIPLAMAIDPSNDILLAYEMNGEPLPPDHGYPLRLVLPGCVGGKMVKWLAKITVSDKESANHFHWHDNKVLPPTVTSADEAEEGYWYQSEYNLLHLNVNSVITAPAHGELLRIDGMTAAGSGSGETAPITVNGFPGYRLQGYAYTGGGNKVTRVDVSLDDGVTWMEAVRHYPSSDHVTGYMQERQQHKVGAGSGGGGGSGGSAAATGAPHACSPLELAAPPRHGYKYWTWCHWSLDVEVWRLLRAREICVRAVDGAINMQPREPTWNILGMMNNCWYRVKVDIDPDVFWCGGGGTGFGGRSLPHAAHDQAEAATSIVASFEQPGAQRPTGAAPPSEHQRAASTGATAATADTTAEGKGKRKHPYLARHYSSSRDLSQAAADAGSQAATATAPVPVGAGTSQQSLQQEAAPVVYDGTAHGVSARTEPRAERREHRVGTASAPSPPVVRFIHPTLPGAVSGGWKKEPLLESLLTPVGEPFPPAPGVPPPPPTAGAPSSSTAALEPEHGYTMEEVAQHASEESAWVVIRGGVYDITSFYSDHPGGKATLIAHAGRDATIEFDSIHGADTYEWREGYRIGYVIGYSTAALADIVAGKTQPDYHTCEQVVGPEVAEEKAAGATAAAEGKEAAAAGRAPTPTGLSLARAGGAQPALQARRWLQLRLREKRIISSDSRVFVFDRDFTAGGPIYREQPQRKAPEEEQGKEEAENRKSARTAPTDGGSGTSSSASTTGSGGDGYPQAGALVQRAPLHAPAASTAAAAVEARAPPRPFGLPVGQHVSLSAEVGGRLVMRPYTPIYPITLPEAATAGGSESTAAATVSIPELGDMRPGEDDGTVRFCIKVYPHGQMTQYLDSLQPGDTSVFIKGPAGHVTYLGRGHFRIAGQLHHVTKVSLVGGGSGITPLYQLMTAMCADDGDETEVALVYSNHTTDDVLLRPQLDALAAKFPHKVTVWYTVSQAPHGEWKYDIGRIHKEMLKARLFAAGPNSLAFVCGPPAMLELAALPILEELGFSDERLVEF